MSSNRAMLFVVVMLLVALIAGCAPSTPVATAPAAPATEAAPAAPATEAAPAAATAMITVKVSASPYLSFAPYYIALEEGFFAEQGLDIEISKVTRSVDTLPALAQGDLDVAGTVISAALLNSMVRESGVRIVASQAQETATMDCAYNGLVIRSSLPLTLTADIAPETLRTLRFGADLPNITGHYLDLVLDRYGLSIDDVTFVELGGSAAFLAALQGGAVDVVALTEPWITRARAAGAGDLWISRTAVVPEAQASALIFGPSLLKDNPEAGMRFMIAYLKGVRQYREGKTERNLAILEKHLELERNVLMDMCLPQASADGMIFSQSIEDFSKWAAERDYMDRPIVADEFWDPRFVEHANAVLGQP